MRLWRGSELREAKDSFKVRETTEKTQFATMALKPGETSGEFGNEHGEADQWLIVLGGKGEAVGESGAEQIGPGDIVLVPAPEKHQFKCTGDEPLRTITFYGPPGYPGLD
jgi:mannose-6-phosphate isomerase-like protein (cupin superfamily)